MDEDKNAAATNTAPRGRKKRGKEQINSSSSGKKEQINKNKKKKKNDLSSNNNNNDNKNTNKNRSNTENISEENQDGEIISLHWDILSVILDQVFPRYPPRYYPTFSLVCKQWKQLVDHKWKEVSIPRVSSNDKPE